MIYATDEELQAGLAKWQDILRLRDWRIFIRSISDWDSGQTLGRITPNHLWKTAVLDINCTVINGLDKHDQEHTLVHELLHLLTRPMVRRLDIEHGDLEEEELCINLVADALLALDRRTLPDTPLTWPPDAKSMQEAFERDYGKVFDNHRDGVHYSPGEKTMLRFNAYQFGFKAGYAAAQSPSAGL